MILALRGSAGAVAPRPDPDTFPSGEKREAGDYMFDPLGLKPKDAAELKIMQEKEINNGRLAMIAVAGMVAQELASGNKLF